MSAPAIAVDALSEIQKRIALITSAEPADPSSALGTGIAELDAVLSRRGIPRGRLTEVAGARGSGKATLLRRMVMETISRGLGVAYVDASRTLAPRDWASVADEAGDGFWVVRPKQASRGAWCADVLLRSGAFALVVLDGAPPLTRSIAVRLTRLAHDAAAALVVVGGDHAPPSMISGALRLHVSRMRRKSRHINRTCRCTSASARYSTPARALRRWPITRPPVDAAVALEASRRTRRRWRTCSSSHRGTRTTRARPTAWRRASEMISTLRRLVKRRADGADVGGLAEVDLAGRAAALPRACLD